MAGKNDPKATLRNALGELGRELARLEDQRERLLQQREAVETAPRTAEEAKSDIDTAVERMGERWLEDGTRRSLAGLFASWADVGTARERLRLILRDPEPGMLAAVFGEQVRSLLHAEIDQIAADRGGDALDASARASKLAAVDKMLAAVDDELAQLQTDIADSGLAVSMEPADMPPLGPAPELTAPPREPEPATPGRHFGPHTYEERPDDGNGPKVTYSDPGEAQKVRPPEALQAESVISNQ